MGRAPDDPQWLSALAGEPDNEANPQTNGEATALRKALRERSERMSRDVPVASQELYQRLLFRLRRERLLPPAAAWKARSVWALAATLVVTVGVVLQFTQPFDGPDEHLRTRGLEEKTVLIVRDPEKRAGELIAGFKAAGEDPKIERPHRGQIVLTVPATPSIEAYLRSQEIEVVPIDGKITLTLTTRGR